MKSHVLHLLLLALLTVTTSLHAQQIGDSNVAVPIKGTIEALGSAELLITVYDRETGGRELYSVATTMPVERNTYFGMINVPETVFRTRHTIFIEVARLSAPAIALETRAQFTRPGGPASGDKAFTILGCSLCFSCGGSYPIFNGAFATAGVGTQERGRSCRGDVTSRIDFRPHLCCQTGTL